MTVPSRPAPDLIFAIAHDLRSPLSVIAGLASREREAPNTPARAVFDKILDEALRASRMLENRAAVARLDAGGAVPRPWVSVEELVGASLARLEARLDGRLVTIRVGEVVARIDPMFGGLVLVNLVDNATRYTPPGSPLEITAARAGAATTIEIADRGPGPSAQTTQLLAAPPPDARHGLAVARRIAAAYDASVELVRRPGGGAVARFTIPDAGELPGAPAEEAAR